MDIKEKYDESSFYVLKGLEPVQQRPGMYTRLEDPTHIILEVIDNACDEALAGFANKIYVKIFSDKSVSVSDNGRGIPVGLHPIEKIPVIELAFTRLHAGGKFNKHDNASAYKYSGGLHGVGVSVTNALADRLDVNVLREGSEYKIGFENGVVAYPLKKIGKIEKGISGTTIHVWPATKYFDQPHVSVNELEKILRSKAMLLPNVEVTFEVEDKGSTTWYYPEGMSQYINDISENSEWLFPPVSIDGTDINQEGSEDGLTCVLGFTAEGTVHRESFVNLIPTRDGGRHMQGLRYGVFKAVQQFMERHSLLPKNIKLEYDDVWSRLSCVLAMRMVDPQFQGQTKDQLLSKHASKLVEKIVSAQFELWLHEHHHFAKKLADLVIEQAYKRNKTALKIDRKKITGCAVLPGKLSDCESTDVNNTELFLVEGDSAGGCCFFSTLIPLVDGRIIQIGDMVSEQEQGKRHFVYTINQHGNIAIEEAINARKTKKHAPLVSVLLNNGETIICTPDHKFMLRDGSYQKAQYLQPNQSLMSFFLKVQDDLKEFKQHAQVFNPKTLKWVYSHSLIDDWNLSHQMKPPCVCKVQHNLVYTQQIKNYKKNLMFRKLPTTITERHFTYRPNSIKQNTFYKVVSVSYLDYTADVYDIEIPNTHNFATNAGVFIHNSAKMGRDRKVQAILPLRGKLLNTWGVDSEKLDSKTIEDIIAAIGIEPHKWGDAINFNNLRYGKIIIMSDADVDGRHIQVLILTLFLRHFPELVRRGHVYLAQPPLFRIDAQHSKKSKNPMRKIYALDQDELDDILKKLKKEGLDESHWNVSRFKGLGEMNAEQLCETTMHINTRRLIQIELTEETWKQVYETFDMMMDDKNASMRRAWMEKNGNYANVDI